MEDLRVKPRPLDKEREAVANLKDKQMKEKNKMIDDQVRAHVLRVCVCACVRFFYIYINL